MSKPKTAKKAQSTVVVIQDFDGRTLRRQFVDPTDALEFRILITRRIQRYEAGLELIPEQVTFAAWAETWLARRKTLRPQSTWSGEEGKLKRIWIPLLGHLKLQAIHGSTLRDALDTLKASGLSNATMNRHRALLHRMWVEAKREQPALVTQNPVSSIPRLPETRHEVCVWTDEEVKRYCETAWEISVGWGVTATVLAWTGMRISEAVALQWNDDKGDQFLVRRLWESVSGNIHGRTKGRRPYSVLIPPIVRRALSKTKKWRGKVKPEDRIAGVLTYGEAQRWHTKTVKLAGLPPNGIHSLRHRVARSLRRLGFTRDDVKDLLGHRSVDTTERYTPSDNAYLAKQAKKKKFGR